MAKRWFGWCLLFSFFLAAACGVLPLDNSAQQIIKSDNDTREYRYIELPNQLKVLIVSDVNVEKSAASLDVHVGSQQDPIDAQGLAHFLEHMLFLGTEKYPQAGDYQQYISAHGGSHNAYTSFEHTNYFFDISPEYFEQGLDRFAQFFIAPLFDEAYVEREKNAVHSEYTSKIKDEQRRGIDVFKQVINPQHPFAKLSVGNLETLTVNEETQASLRAQLLDFYQQYYSSNLMTLVLIGSESLDQLEQMARSRFSAIKNNKTNIADISAPLIESQRLPLLIEVKPEKSMRTLSLAFLTEDTSAFYAEKPLHYLGNILGHEGKGSLLSYLKQQGWAEGLSAGQGIKYRGGGSFNISIKLTDSGAKDRDKVIEAVFQAINRIKNSPNKAWLFAEQKAIAEQHFRYQEKQASAHYAVSLASNMHYYPLEDVLRGDYLMKSYNALLVERFISYLTPENAVITFTAPSAKVDRTSYFYQTDYSVAKVDNKRLQRWSAVGINQAITLPEKNAFIAERLEIVTGDSQSDIPRKLSTVEGVSLWYRQDRQFNTPKGSVFVSYRSPFAADTIEHKVALTLLVDVLADELNEFSYAATLAGLNYSLQPHMRGLSIKVNGFSDKQPLLLKKVLQVLSQPQFDAERFANIKREHVRSLENRNKLQPYHLVMAALPELLYHQTWTAEQQLDVYRNITLEDIKAFQQRLFSKGQIDMLVHGNYQQAQAEQYAKQVAIALLDKNIAAPPVLIAQLAEQKFSRKLESDYADSSYALYIQSASTDKLSRAAMGVSAQVLRADFYTKLRTEQQLGYIVSSGAYPQIDVPGIFFLVQSPVAGPVQLQGAIDRFLKDRLQTLEGVTVAEFETQRKAVLSRLSEAPQNLLDQSELYWRDISQNYEQFDFRAQLIAAMKSLTFQQWRDYFVNDVIENPRRMVIFSEGQFVEAGEVSGQPVVDVEAFKESLPSYSFQ
ncbi:insulinase family protein [Oceanicoccus sp. KOV_DT_Chl]|uniref:insulinase family protein n=1 Tax=Oceanicoccus sp. KOV_DT_Chl TaxID=1904639 RepID=UPI000C796A8A|nr:insulinase family protein [Oceanicoccus sp. KOV_DT_Chl]